MNAIGGYFELADREHGEFIHNKGALLNTGRNAFEWILLSLGDLKKVYLPCYTCEVVLEPLMRHNIPWQFYHINERLEIAEEVKPSEGEYVVVNNYFGVKDTYIRQVSSSYGSKLIVDCAQAFFASPLDGIKSFYSARKFVGVADGGVAYGYSQDTSALEEDDSYLHSAHLFIRKELGPEVGFASYRKDEGLLANQIMRRMSILTKDILFHINYQAIIKKRRKNYSYLEEALASRNLLKLPHLDSFVAPMAYPLMVQNGAELRKRLIESKVFVPRFWPNETIPEALLGDIRLSDAILPLPIDQRYGEEEMKRIIEIINN